MAEPMWMILLLIPKNIRNGTLYTLFSQMMLVLDTGCGIQDAEYRLQDAGCKLTWLTSIREPESTW
jgi:hypothetical protein